MPLHLLSDLIQALTVDLEEIQTCQEMIIQEMQDIVQSLYPTEWQQMLVFPQLIVEEISINLPLQTSIVKPINVQKFRLSSIPPSSLLSHSNNSFDHMNITFTITESQLFNNCVLDAENFSNCID